MPADTAPSRSRKNPASGSRRTWNGRSGSPRSSVRLSAGAQTASTPQTASASPTSAPSGKANRRAKAALPAGRSESAPSASHAATAARLPASGERASGIPRQRLFHAHPGQGPGIRREEVDAGTLLPGGGEDHPVRGPEAHLAGREVRDHDREAADERRRVVRGADAGEERAGLAAEVDGQPEQLVGAVDGLRSDDLRDPEVELGEVVDRDRRC